MSAPAATILVVTRNRASDLRRALASAASQRGAIELLVVDDASTDGTAELVRAEFPQAVLLVSDRPSGYVAQRNRGVEAASAPVVFSIDDDAEFTTPAVVEQTLAELEPAQVGAVAIPVEEPDSGLAPAPDDGRVHVVAAYVGTAHAVRRDLFLELGGYRRELVHQGEESDYCLRMLEAGYVTRLGRADPIRHHRSPSRDVRRWHRQGARNNVLLAWQNAPLPYLPIRLAAASAGAIAFGLRIGRPTDKAAGVAQAYGAIVAGRAARRPVGGSTFRLFRRLVRAGSLPLDDVAPSLESMRWRRPRTRGLTR